MANVDYNVNLRTLYVMKYLLEHSDETHDVTTAELIEYLHELGIDAQRKSIYADLDTLGPDQYGLDIISRKGKHHIGERHFELQEVKLLVDMVQSSNFITKNKSDKLISKLQGLVSKNDARILNSQIVARNRVKSTNEQMFINIDRISDAIKDNHPIEFKYFKYDIDKQKIYQHDAKIYLVSPYALIAGEDNYYMVAYAHETNDVRHFRVDRMESIQILTSPREGMDVMADVDLANYPTKVFNMYGGQEYVAHLSFRRSLVDTVMDRFGKELILVPDFAGEWFSINVPVMESPQFFAWLAGFGDSAVILGPAPLKQHMKEHIEKIRNMYL